MTCRDCSGYRRCFERRGICRSYKSISQMEDRYEWNDHGAGGGGDCPGYIQPDRTDPSQGHNREDVKAEKEEDPQEILQGVF